ncbi:MAG: trigger factor [Oscillospiraceae bacterium]|nr:trigger factor [Oscillospiraceae bacterium]
MKLNTYEKKEKSTAELIVVVESAEFNTALDAVYKKNRNQMAVPGFRRGKAPRKVIESAYGASVFYNDALDIVLPDACAFGVKESELRAVGYPNVSNIEVGDDKSLTITYTVALYPEVTIGDYHGLAAVKPVAVVEDSAVDSEVEAARLRQARLEIANRPLINGDTATIDFVGYVDGETFDGGTGEDYELVIGSNSFISGFEEKMHGMQVGEERDLDLEFPENYQAEHLAGKPVIFKVTLKELRTKILPEADDDLAKDVSEFDTLADYRADIRKNLLESKEKETEGAFEDALLEVLAATLEGDIPDAMADEYIDRQVQQYSQQLQQYGLDLATYFNMSGSSEEQFRESMRPSAEKQVRVSLALEKVVAAEGFTPTEEEIEQAYKETAERYEADIETVKNAIPAETIVNDLNVRAAVKVIRESAIALDPPPDEVEAAEAATAEVETEEKKPKKRASKKKVEASDETDAAEAPTETPKKSSKSKAKAEEKTEE